MKTFLCGGLSNGAVAVAFMAAAHVSGLWRVVAIFAALTVLQLLFVQKYPKAEALKWALWHLKPGEKVTVEGK